MPDRPVRILIVNGCESEPMVVSDHRLMAEYPNGVVEGARIFQRICGASRLIFALKTGLKEIADAVVREGGEVRTCPDKYPTGSERQLIKSVLGRTVPRGGLPYQVGCIVCNAATCYAGFQAVVYGKPLIERVVTVAGDGVAEPRNLLAPIGVRAADLIRAGGGYAGKTGAIIFGGPMTGYAQTDDRTPLTKETTAVIVLQSMTAARILPCVRCGRCVDACPMGLMPLNLYRLIDDAAIAEAGRQGLRECLECGGCAYVCPSRLPLVHLFRYGKQELAGAIP
jgi:electron transport complex protein RnfC